MSAKAKVTSKGQITLPKKLREDLNLKTGDTVQFEPSEDGGYRMIAKTARFADLRGVLKPDGPPLSADDIVEIVNKARNASADAVASQAVERKPR